MMANRYPHRLRGLITGLIAAVVLGTIGYCSASNGDDKKDDRPAAPMSSAAALQASPAASPAAMQATPKATCQDVADTGSLEYRTGTKTLTRHMMGGNSTGRVFYEDICEFKPAGSKDIVAQTSYQFLNERGLQVHRYFLNNKGDSVTTVKIPANQLPKGVSDGYYFTPRHDASFRNPGVTLRVGNQLATVSFRGFNGLDFAARKPFLDNAALVLTNRGCGSDSLL